MLASGLLIAGGLVALTVGANLLVRAGAGLASWLGIRPMIIGLTVVSLGTSVPELAVGIDAAVSGSPGLAVGNIVGTNLVNLLLILGLSAVLVPIAFDRATLRFDLPAMTVAALLLCLLSIDGVLTRPDGVILLLGGVAYTIGLVRASRRGTGDRDQAGAANGASAAAGHQPMGQLLRLLVGMVVIVIGAELLVDGAVSTARSLGISEAVIGLTIVAVGTSAPELVTTVMSTLRGDRELAIGNLIGSSIYNIGAVLGLTILVAPHGLPVPDEVLTADLAFLAVAAVVAVPVVVSGARMSRVEGGFFVAAYIGYVAWLLLARV